MVESVPLPQQPLDPRALGRIPDLLADRESDSAVFSMCRALGPGDQEVGGSESAGATTVPTVVGGAPDAQPARKVESQRYFFEIVGTRSLRPFNRRRVMIRRPVLVAIRARKPCVRLREMFEG